MGEREDSTTLQSTCLEAAKVIGRHFHGYVDELIRVADNLVRSEFLDRQIVGADVLCRLERRRCEKVTHDKFLAWVETTDIGTFIVRGNVHTEVLNRLNKVLTLTMIKCPELVKEFLDDAKIVHVSRKSVMYDIAAEVMGAMDFADSMPVINSVLDDIVEPEMMSLLVLLVDRFSRLANEEGTQKLIGVMLDILVLTNAEGRFMQTVGRLMKDEPVLQGRIFGQCCELLGSSLEQHTILNILMNLIEVTAEIPNMIIERVISCVKTDGTNRGLLMKFIPSVLIKIHQPMTAEWIGAFSEVECDNDLWNMLRGLFEVRKEMAVDDSGFAFVEKLINEYSIDEHTGQAFVSFLKVFILHYNTKNETIRIVEKKGAGRKQKGCTMYEFRRLPIHHLDGVVQIMLHTRIQPVKIECRKFTLDILKGATCVTNEELVSYVLELLRPGLDGNASKKCIALDFLFDFVKEIEAGYDISDFQTYRHSYSSTDRKAKVYVSGIAEEPYEMKTALTVSPKIFANRVSAVSKKATSTFYLTFHGGDISHRENLAAAGVADGSTLDMNVIDCNGVDPGESFVMPSIVLDRMNFHDVLFEILETHAQESVRTSVCRILNWLPGAKSYRAVEGYVFNPSDDEYIRGYRIRMWLNHLRTLDNRAVGEHANQLVDIMVSRENGFENIIEFFSVRFVPELVSMADVVFPFILSISGDASFAKFRFMSQTIVMKMVAVNPETLNDIIDEHIDLFEKFICLIPEPTKNIAVLTGSLTNRSCLMHMCLTHLSVKSAPHMNIAILFENIDPSVSHAYDISGAVDTCVRVMLKGTGKWFGHLCEAVGLILSLNEPLAREKRWIVAEVLPLAVDCLDVTSQKGMFQLCSIVLTASGEYAEVTPLLEPYATVKCDKYDYEPSVDMRSRSGPCWAQQFVLYMLHECCPATVVPHDRVQVFCLDEVVYRRIAE